MTTDEMRNQMQNPNFVPAISVYDFGKQCAAEYVPGSQWTGCTPSDFYASIYQIQEFIAGYLSVFPDDSYARRLAELYEVELFDDVAAWRCWPV